MGDESTPALIRLPAQLKEYEFVRGYPLNDVTDHALGPDVVELNARRLKELRPASYGIFFRSNN